MGRPRKRQLAAASQARNTGPSGWAGFGVTRCLFGSTTRSIASSASTPIRHSSPNTAGLRQKRTVLEPDLNRLDARDPYASRIGNGEAVSGRLFEIEA